MEYNDWSIMVNKQNNLVNKHKNLNYSADFTVWTPPKSLIYPCSESEADSLRQLQKCFAPKPIYADMESVAKAENRLVELTLNLPDGHVPFLENTHGRCTSPYNKQDSKTVNAAGNWVQRVDTWDNIHRRLTDGWIVSLMFGERAIVDSKRTQYIRNSNNWRGNFGILLDLDTWRDDGHPDAPEPVWSLAELLERYPILRRMCSLILPSASSLHNGNPFKARGVVPVSEPIFDRRLFQKVAELILVDVDCMIAGPTKNPIAGGYGNNFQEMWYNEHDPQWSTDVIKTAKYLLQKERAESVSRKNKNTYYQITPSTGRGEGPNIAAYIQNVDPLPELLRQRLLTECRGNRYKWHASDNEGSCEVNSNVIKIFSGTMGDESPDGIPGPVNAHRFLLFIESGLDMKRASDRDEINRYLYKRGFGSDPDDYRNRQRKRDKLKLSTGQPEPITVSQADSRVAMGQSIDAFLNSSTDTNTETDTDTDTDTDSDTNTETDTDSDTNTDTIQIFLLKEQTGSGKSTAMIAKTSAAQRRTLVQAPTKDVAAQLLDIATAQGYKRPVHLKGRAHTWAESDIQKLQLHERGILHFDKSLCIMVDEIEKHEAKRIPARFYCLHQCPFLDDCKYLAQFSDIKDADFVSLSNPSIFFDLRGRGFLDVIVNSESDFTDEELAMDAILEIETEPRKKFDMAIIDDYKIDDLMVDISLSKLEIQLAADTWAGTAAGIFLNNLLDAFTKQTPAELIGALRFAYDSVADDRARVIELLSKHGRVGTILERRKPLYREDTDEILADTYVEYDDGNRPHVIPISDAAEAYLKTTDASIVSRRDLTSFEIDDVVVVPTSIASAVFLKIDPVDITPRWPTDANLLRLFEILFDFVEIDDNAPIKREYRLVGAEIDEVITFTIPPQAPVGIFDKMALLSAVTDTDSVQQLFKGQPVAFDVRVGEPIRHADGVNVLQYTDRKITASSTFHFEQTDGAYNAVSLNDSASKLLQRINGFAAGTDGLSVFISYKEFTDDRFSGIVDNFDLVRHFDDMAGLNFDGLKLLVIFGYPKVRHEVVLENARKRFANVAAALPTGSYEDLTVTREFTDSFGITSLETRYKHPQLEAVRAELGDAKLQQAFGRGRHSIWPDTTTIVMTSVNIGSITEFASLFGTDALFAVSDPSELVDKQLELEAAISVGDAKAFASAAGVSDRTGRRRTSETREQQSADVAQSNTELDADIRSRFDAGDSKRKIGRDLGIHNDRVNAGLKRTDSPL